MMRLRWLGVLTLLLLAGSTGPDASIATAAGAPTREIPIAWLDGPPTDPPPDSFFGSLSTQSVDITGDFDMVGLTWTGSGPSKLWVKARDVAGKWGPWSEVPLVEDHGEDSGDGKGGSDPIYTGPATAIRLAVVDAPTDARAHLINTVVLASTVSGMSANSVPAPDPWWEGAGFVRDRSQWDTADCRRDGAEYNFSSAQAVVVHHTAGSSNYTESQVPALIAGICSFHVNGRGWDDIGYNFIIDKFGNIWEGRTASKVAPISGAHTAGFNSQTQGVAMIGNFESQQPAQAQLNALRQMLEWLTGWHSIDPDGSVTLVAGTNAKGFEEGEVVVATGIVGHRDLGQTACPGGAFYATMDVLRSSLVPTNFGFDPTLLRCDGRVPTRFGTLGHDQLWGSDGPDVFVGMDGDDIIRGLGGDDVICGDAGDDVLIGGGGRDTVIGSTSFDACGAETRVGCELITNEEMLFYKAGGYKYYDVATTGALSSLLRSGNDYSSTWDIIISVDLDGDAKDEIFFYKRDGSYGYYDLNSDGSLGAPINTGSGYSTGWDSITAVDLDGDGQDEMFFYRVTGSFRYYEVNPDGSLGAAVNSGSGYSTGWDSITAVDLDGDGQDEMFFYRETGSFRYYDVYSDGSLGAPINSGSGYSTGWNTITAVDLDGDDQDEMFFYRSTGSFRYYDISQNGTLSAPLQSGTGYSPGWTAIASIDLDGWGP